MFHCSSRKLKDIFHCKTIFYLFRVHSFFFFSCIINIYASRPSCRFLSNFSCSIWIFIWNKKIFMKKRENAFYIKMNSNMEWVTWKRRLLILERIKWKTCACISLQIHQFFLRHSCVYESKNACLQDYPFELICMSLLYPK